MQKDIYKYSAVFIAIYIILNVATVILSENKAGALDVILSNLSGYSNYQFNLMEFIRYLLFFILPIFFIGSTIEKEKKMYNAQVAIRYPSRRVWNRLVENSLNKYIIWYFSIFMGVLFFISLVLTIIYRSNSKYVSDLIQYMGISESQLYYVISLSLILKLLELFYYKNVFMLWNKVTNNNVAAYIITFCGFILAIVVPTKFIVSYGSSSIYNLAEGMARYGLTTTVISAISVIVTKIAIIKAINLIWRKN